MSNRTLQAVRQTLYAALTSPPLTYQINGGPVQTLPVANVVPKNVWLAGGAQAPSPLVCISVGGRGVPFRTLEERFLSARIWTVSAEGQDECTELYEAVRARIVFADGEAPPEALDISRAAGAGTLPVAFREIRETRVSDADYERETNRWYLMSELRIAAA